MKKLLSLLLILALLPCAALADTVIDVGAFQVCIPESAYVVTHDKIANSVIANIIPDPNSPSGVYANINVTWGLASKADITFTASEYAEFVLNETLAGLTAENIAVSNAQVLASELDQDEGYIFLYFSFDADYTGMGVNLVTTLYMVQESLCVDGDGMYTITFTADSADGVANLMQYFENCMI